jgi:hypothetical protein
MDSNGIVGKNTGYCNIRLLLYPEIFTKRQDLATSPPLVFPLPRQFSQRYFFPAKPLGLWGAIVFFITPLPIYDTIELIGHSKILHRLIP